MNNSYILFTYSQVNFKLLCFTFISLLTLPFTETGHWPEEWKLTCRGLHIINPCSLVVVYYRVKSPFVLGNPGISMKKINAPYGNHIWRLWRILSVLNRSHSIEFSVTMLSGVTGSDSLSNGNLHLGNETENALWANPQRCTNSRKCSTESYWSIPWLSLVNTPVSPKHWLSECWP